VEIPAAHLDETGTPERNYATQQDQISTEEGELVISTDVFLCGAGMDLSTWCWSLRKSGRSVTVKVKM
jgi:hypothetical protein